MGGRAVGALAGLIVGHIHDTRPETPDEAWSGLWSSYGDFAANIEQAAFTMGVVVLSAKMAKSDGRVTREEIEAFKRVFHITPAQEAAVGRLFDRARLTADGLNLTRSNWRMCSATTPPCWKKFSAACSSSAPPIMPG